MGVPQNILWFTKSFHRCWLLLMMPRKWAGIVDPFYRGELGPRAGRDLPVSPSMLVVQPEVGGGA